MNHDSGIENESTPFLPIQDNCYPNVLKVKYIIAGIQLKKNSRPFSRVGPPRNFFTSSMSSWNLKQNWDKSYTLNKKADWRSYFEVLLLVL